MIDSFESSYAKIEISDQRQIEAMHKIGIKELKSKYRIEIKKIEDSELEYIEVKY